MELLWAGGFTWQHQAPQVRGVGRRMLYVLTVVYYQRKGGGGLLASS